MFPPLERLRFIFSSLRSGSTEVYAGRWEDKVISCPCLNSHWVYLRRGVKVHPPWLLPIAMLKPVLAVLIAVALAATLLILLSGVFTMLRGSEFNAKYGNIMMRARVISQGITVLLLIAYFLAP